MGIFVARDKRIPYGRIEENARLYDLTRAQLEWARRYSRSSGEACNNRYFEIC